MESTVPCGPIKELVMVFHQAVTVDDLTERDITPVRVRLLNWDG